MPFGRSSLADLFAIFQPPASKPCLANSANASNTLSSVAADVCQPKWVCPRRLMRPRLSPNLRASASRRQQTPQRITEMPSTLDFRLQTLDFRNVARLSTYGGPHELNPIEPNR